MPMTCNQNFILEKNNFIKKEECDILIKELKDKVNKAEKVEYGYECFDLEGTPIFNQIQKRKFIRNKRKKFNAINLAYWK